MTTIINRQLRRGASLLSVLLLCGTMLAFAAGTAATAGAAGGDGSISGTVVDNNSAPMAGVTVSASSGSTYLSTTTDSTGAYTIASVPDDSYTVQFSANDGIHADQYYQGAFFLVNATPVVVAGGAAVTGIDGHLQVGSTITGTVTNADASPSANTTVLATGPNQDVHSTTTAADGTYTLAALPPSVYTVQFQPTDGVHTSQWWDGATDESGATSITLASGQTQSGVDATLAVGASISGVVYSPTLQPISDVVITAEAGSSIYYATTQANGSYSFGGLPAGSYRLQFQPPDGTYRAQYWNGKDDYSSADLISVELGDAVTDISPILQLAGTISGTVTDASSNPIANATVFASGRNGGYGSAITDGNGDYTISNLTADTYTVQFSSDSGYLSQYYDGVSDYSAATALTVNGGDALTGIDASLQLGGTITGTVTDALGNPLSDIQVDAYGNNTGYGSTTTDANGQYTINGLDTDDYQVYFSDQNQVFAPEYYDDAINWGDASLVSVTAGGTVSDVDAVLADGATVSGTVTDSAAQPVADVSVTLENTSDGSQVAYASTASDGTYTVPAIPAGTYLVSFQSYDPNLLSVYWDGVTTAEEATPVTLTAGQALSGIDATLPDAPTSISGTVDVDGSPVGDICATLWSGSSQLRSSCTDGGGNYRMDNVAPGTYTISFQDQQGVLPTTWFGGAATQGASDPLTVAADEHADASITLSPYDHSISGMVSHEYGDPSTSSCVYLYNPGAAGTFAGHGTCTGSAGTYLLSGIPSGDYVLAFVDPMGLKPTMWYSTSDYRGVANQADATALTLDDTTTSQRNVDITTDPASGSIIGQVTDPSGTTGLAGICLYAYAWNSSTNTLASTTSAGTCTNAKGGFVLSGLPLTGAPKYQVAMVDPTGVYPTRWAEVTSSPYSASIANSTITRPTSSSAFQLGVFPWGFASLSVAQGGSISGTVTDQSTGLPRVGACVYVDFATDGVYAGIGATTDADGHYTLPNLADGTGSQGYKVGFYPDCSAGQPPTSHWWNDASSEAEATAVDVYSGLDTGSIDANF